MRALAMYEGGRFELEDIPVPETPPGWGLIRTIASAAGLFQAQMAAGMLDTLGFPRILGHEIVGEVVEVSSDAAPQPGSVVVADAVVGCGVCEWCIRGDDMICPWMRHLGINIDGGFADYVAVPESHMFPIKAETPVEEAVMLGSALPASVHAARRAGVRGGDRVVVTGVGSIGLTICQVARAMGATSVVAVDIADDRLDAAAPWTDGAVNVSGVEPREAAQMVRDTLGPPAGADIVFEAAGHINSVDLGVHAVRRGGTVWVRVWAPVAPADGHLRGQDIDHVRQLPPRLPVERGFAGHHLRFHPSGLRYRKPPARHRQPRPQRADRRDDHPGPGAGSSSGDRRLRANASGVANASGQWTVASGQWPVASGQWSVVSGQWSVVSGQWSVVSGQWSVVSGQWSVVSEWCNRRTMSTPHETEGLTESDHPEVAHWPLATGHWPLQATGNRPLATTSHW